MEISTTEWTPITEDSWLPYDRYWIAKKDGELLLAWSLMKVNEESGFYTSAKYWEPISNVTHIMRLVVPKHPTQGEQV
jgi:hypothetical protein